MKPNLVLLHGFPLDSRVWIDQIKGLSDIARVIAPDLRGFGQSKSTESFSIESLADDVHDMLQTTDALPCILAGLSMGGYVALSYIKKYSSDLNKLILVDTKAEADTPDGKIARNQMIELAKAQGSKAIAEKMMPKMLAHHDPATVARLQQIMEECPARTIQHALAAMRDRPDFTPILPSIKQPTLIIVGESDAITSPAMAQAMARQIPSSQLTIIKNAGHMSPLEEPAQVTEALRQFLS